MFVWILVFLLNLAPARASAAQNGVIPSDFKEGYYSMGAELTYLSTSANYTDHDTSLDFSDGYGYNEFQSLIYGRFDLSNNLSFYSELPLNYASSENPTNTFSSFKAAGLAVGGNFEMDLPFIKFIPELKGYYSIEKYDRSAEEVLTSDAASYLEAGSHIFKTFSNYQIHGYLSYKYRTEGFSSLLNYQTDLSYKTGSLTLTFGLKGFQSVTDDENTKNPAYRNTYLDDVNGSSLIYASVNPSRLDLFGQVKYSLNDSIDIYGGVGKSISGKNSGDILTATFGLEYFFEPLGQGPKERYRDSVPPEDFQSEDENIEPKIEENIKTYDQPIKKKVPHKKKIIHKKKFTPRNSLQGPRPTRPVPHHRPRSSNGNNLEISKKQLGKTTTSTSPIKSKPKSKKPMRVHVEF